MLTPARLTDLLRRGVPGASVEVDPDGAQLVAIVVSDSFEGREEHERQEVVWKLLIGELSDDELSRVAFVFTNTAAEIQQADRDAAAHSPDASGP